MRFPEDEVYRLMFVVVGLFATVGAVLRTSGTTQAAVIIVCSIVYAYQAFLLVRGLPKWRQS